MRRQITCESAKAADKAFRAMRRYIELAATSGPQLAASYEQDARLICRLGQTHARVARELLYYRLENCLI